MAYLDAICSVLIDILTFVVRVVTWIVVGIAAILTFGAFKM